jgi:hypothetical protein
MDSRSVVRNAQKPDTPLSGPEDSMLEGQENGMDAAGKRGLMQ